MKNILLIFFAWRMLLNIPLLIGEKLLTYRTDYLYTNIWYFTQEYFPVSSVLLYPWANFDGVHYLAIASKGYTDNIRFFPLYPLIVGGLSTSSFPFFTALILSHLFFIGSLYVLYKLLRLDYKHSIAITTIIFLLVFPTSFFFVSIYTESLFLLLALLSFYFARRNSWLLASLCGMFLSATRLVGICILPALLWELYKEKQSSNRAMKQLFYLLFIPIGFLSFVYYNFVRWGNPLYFIEAQGHLANARETGSIVLFPQTMYRYIKILTTLPTQQFEWWIALLELTSFIFAATLLYLAWKRGVRKSYLVFSILCFLIPTLSGTFSGLPRYILPLFPIYIAIEQSSNRIMKIVYVILSIILLFLLLMLFSKGYYIS